METPVLEETNSRRRNTILAIAAGAAVLCCACLVVVLAIYGWGVMRPGETQEFPVEEFPATIAPIDPDLVLDTPDAQFGIGDAPVGGLGNDILRNDTWQTIASAAIGQGCDRPVGEESTIEVLQEPDANGVWVEQWTVACASGDSYPFEVEYILDDTGATFNIRSLP